MILVDDGTVQIAEPLVDQLLCTTAGRATQMNCGVAAANGALLWFVHADTELPAGAARRSLAVPPWAIPISPGFAVAKRYPEKGKSQILADLIATTQGEEGKWFATAKEIRLFDLVLELANCSSCDPKTLTRAARDFLESEPGFALGCAMAALRWLSEGWGYEVTSADVVEAYDRAIDAAATLNKVDDVTDKIRQLIESNESASTLFVRQALQARMRAHSSSFNEIYASKS